MREIPPVLTAGSTKYQKFFLHAIFQKWEYIWDAGCLVSSNLCEFPTKTLPGLFGWLCILKQSNCKLQIVKESC